MCVFHSQIYPRRHVKKKEKDPTMLTILFGLKLYYSFIGSYIKTRVDHCSFHSVICVGEQSEWLVGFFVQAWKLEYKSAILEIQVRFSHFFARVPFDQVADNGVGICPGV